MRTLILAALLLSCSPDTSGVDKAEQACGACFAAGYELGRRDLPVPDGVMYTFINDLPARELAAASTCGRCHQSVTRSTGGL